MMNSMGRKYEENEDRLRILKKSFIKMFEEETLADFVIKIDDETINTHRCVLAQNSEVFKRMLGQNMIEKEIGEIKIVDCSVDCFRAMLEFFYSGEIEISTFEKLGEDLYAIADKYEVVTLKEVCEHYMAMSITSTNFKKRYDCAKTYGLLMLEKSCIKYIYANREEFLISKEWEEFKSVNGESAFKMLEDALLGKFDINGKFCFLSESEKNDTDVDFDSFASFGFGSGT
ncbi:unnamed protein product [Meloidogyne enterolobii]|uniref:Uncharacterized protein n=1 Tax=Meloidogyne enterolobii TaxID=390850 RepID=A0ACB0YYY9_MELEN